MRALSMRAGRTVRLVRSALRRRPRSGPDPPFRAERRRVREELEHVPDGQADGKAAIEGLRRLHTTVCELCRLRTRFPPPMALHMGCSDAGSTGSECSREKIMHMPS